MNHPLHQIQVAFSPEEDRLLLSISTTAHEIRFWLTRRFIKLVWPALQKAMEATAGLVADAPVVPTSQIPMHGTPQKQTSQQTDSTGQLAADAKQTPLGPLPILVTRARLEALPDGKYLMGLHPQQDNGLEMALEPRILHALGSLLFNTIAKADWDLSLSLPASKQAFEQGNGVWCHVESNYKFN